MGRIVLAAFGSLGSVHPYLAVASALKSRGHRVTIASAETHRLRFESQGFTFHPVRPDRTVVTEDAEASRRSTELKKGSEFAVKNLLRYADQTYDDLMDACKDAGLFISHPGAFTGPLVAEKLDIPWLSIALAPATLFSAYDPPVLPSMPWLAHAARFGHLPHRLIFLAFKKLTRGWMKPLDELRRRVGLPPTSKHPFFDGMFSPFGTLGWFSSLLAAWQPDWPVNCQVTGFPLPKNNQSRPALAPDLAEFLEAGDPPVVFTLGSNVVREAGNFYQESLEAVRRLGCRAVLLTGTDPRNHPAGAPWDSIFATAYAPHSALFPRAAAVVHQGGIGTLAEAMSAGVPSLIVPHVHDQPDNAFRAAKLGIARVESRARYNARRAAAHLRDLLTKPEYRARAVPISSHVNRENGQERACAAIEKALARSGQQAGEEREVWR